MSQLASRPHGMEARIRFRVLASLALLTGLAVVGIAFARPASAHAVLVSSSPQDGARVNTQPAAVELRFDEVIEPISAAEQVISTTGARADTGKVAIIDGGTTIVLPLKPNLPDGTYSATWRVVSADTHVVSGSITFGIGVEPGAGVTNPTDHTRALAVTDDAAQALVYGGIVLLVGVGAAAAVLWPWALTHRRTAGAFRVGWAALFVGGVLQFLVQGPRADNRGLAGLVHFDGVSQTLNSTYGEELIGRGLLLLMILPLVSGRTFRQPGRTAVAAAAAAGFAILVSVVLPGHEGVGPNVALAMPAATLHLAAMSLWLGGLVLLVVVVLPTLRHGGVEATAVRLRRWSATAYGCVVALVITGEYLASRQISPVQALWSTRYGIVLLIKIGLVVAMLAVAFFTQRRVVALTASTVESPAEHGPGPVARLATTMLLTAQPAKAGLQRDTVRRVSRNVCVEAVVAAGVLAVTTILVSEPSARATYGPAITVVAPLGQDRVQVHVNTTRRGPQVLDVSIVDAAGRPAPAQAITASLSSASVAALDVRLRKVDASGSSWRSSNAVVPLPGVWTLTLDVTLDAADAYATSTSYTVW